MIGADQLWTWDHYILERKVKSLKNPYWILDGMENKIAITNRKAFAWRDEIQIRSLLPEHDKAELVKIKQEKGLDWVISYTVTDSLTAAPIGILKRNEIKSDMGADEWSIHNMAGDRLGRVYEGRRRGMVRQHVPFAGLIAAMKLTVEVFGTPVGVILQTKKAVGDHWELRLEKLPPAIDRRLLVAITIMMAVTEQFVNETSSNRYLRWKERK